MVENSLLELLGELGAGASEYVGVIGESGLNGGLGLEFGCGTYFIVWEFGMDWRESLRCLAIVLLCLGLARSVRGAELDFGRLFRGDAAAGTDARRALLV